MNFKNKIINVGITLMAIAGVVFICLGAELNPAASRPPLSKSERDACLAMVTACLTVMNESAPSNGPIFKLVTVAPVKPANRATNAPQVSGEIEELDYIMQAKTWQHQLSMAFCFALPFTNMEPARFQAGYNLAVVAHLRRAALCEDAPQWVKNLLPGTTWWATNLNTNNYWFRDCTNGCGINPDKVDRNDLP